MPAGTASTLKFLAGGGEMGALIRAKDWSQTPLGPPETWPQSLKTCVRIILTSRQPMFVWWGNDLINLYNDPYQTIVGGKHPWALGQPAPVVWREIWEEVGPRAETALRQNEGTYDEALLLIMERNGYPEETYYTFSYSPVPGDHGGPEGIICANTDDTRRIVGERQLRTLTALGKSATASNTLAEAYENTVRVLAGNKEDFPFLALYELENEGTVARLVGKSPADLPDNVAPASVSISSLTSTSLLSASVVESGQAEVVEHVRATFGALPAGIWAEAPDKVLLVPIAQSGQSRPFAVLVAGCNPYQQLDETYLGFFGLVADQIAISLTNVRAYEEERRRAEALRAIDAAKTAFFSNVSHEFRTPLTLMLGPIEEALKANGQLPDPVQENLQTAHRNALRLQKLVNTLLDFSRIEAGRMRASYEPTDLAALTTDLASTFRSAIERAGMRLAVDCPPLPEPVYVDREMWEKIVLNLLSNAHKYTLEGRITVTLSAEHGQAVLRVQDTGVGIPDAELPRIFERFHRVAGSRGRSFEGTGIGLSLLKELVGLHGGTIAAESEPGLGSTFTVRIPLGKAHLPALPEAPPAPEGGALLSPQKTSLSESFLSEIESLTAPPEGGTLRGSNVAPPSGAGGAARILVVDDNADMRAYVQRLLEPHYRVSVAPDGQVAQWLVAEHRPDLVLSDVMMPVMDGLELLKTLKADPQTATIPVVLLSARAGEEAAIEGYEAGADDYLVKPFSANELLARVRAQLSMARIRSENERQLQNLFRQAPVGIVILRGPELRFELVNDFYVRLVGRRHASDLIGRPILEAIPEIIDQGYFGLLTQVMQTGEPMIFTEQPVHLIRQEQLETVYLNFTYEALPASEPGVFVVITDVTQHVLARRRVEESEHQLRDVFEQAPTAIAMFRGPEFVVELANPRLCQFWGRTQAEVLGKPLFKALPEAAGQGFEELLAGVLQTGRAFVGTELPVTLERNGRLETVYFDFVYHPHPNADGAVDRIILVAQEVTERTQARQQLEDSKRQLQTLFEQAPVGIAMLRGPEHTFELVNDFYVNLANRQHPEELLGKPLFEALPELEGQGFEQLLLNVMQTGEPFVAKEQVVRVMQNGQLEAIYVDFTFQPLPAPDSGVFVVVTDVTESILSRRKIEESENRLSLALEAAELGTWEYDLRSGAITASERTTELHGLAPGEAFSLEGGLNTAAETDRQRVAEAVAHALRPESGGEYNVEYTLATSAEGPPRVIQAKGKAFFDENGEAYRIIGTALDVTEEKRAETALRESDRWFRQLADSMPQIVWTARPDGHLDYFNQRWYEFIDGNQGFGDAGWLPILHPDDRQPCLAHWQRCLQTGEPYRFEFRLDDVRQPGNYRWYLALATAFRNTDGRILKWMGTCTDIDDQKRSEATLRESEARFRQLADFMPPIVWTAQPDGYLDYYNKQWYEFTGFEEGAGGDQSWLPILHPDDVQPCLDTWYHSIRSGEPYQIEYRFKDRRRPGEYCWFLGRAVPVRDERGAIVKWFGTCVDIQAQKTEAERLEALVQNRTEALNQANVELQRTNLNLSQFAYVASHDLQEPLRKIQAFGDMLLKRNAAQLDEAGTDRIRRMQDAAERMSGLIKDLLEYSRVSSYRETFAPVELNPLLASVRSDLAVLIREKKGRLLADPLPTVNGDATQLRQVLQNLLSNAFKFSHPDVPPVVEIRCRVVSGAEAKGLSLKPDASFYEISVRDNGIGFDQAYADRIFEAFQRLHGRGEYPGTGIGLAIVRKVAENHHGGVTVRSGVGEGATFRVYLPVG